MNGYERVMATINHKPVDRTPIDCWLYQKQFLERLEADYGPREKFIEEFGIDVFVGLMPFPNQHGRLPPAARAVPVHHVDMGVDRAKPGVPFGAVDGERAKTDPQLPALVVGVALGILDQGGILECL